MAGALYSGIRGGLLVAVVIALTNIVQAEPESALTYHNIVLLLLLGALVGLAVNLARESQVRLEAALTASERLAERERIGRQVHDEVLLEVVEQLGQLGSRHVRQRGPHLAGVGAHLDIGSGLLGSGHAATSFRAARRAAIVSAKPDQVLAEPSSSARPDAFRP